MTSYFDALYKSQDDNDKGEKGEDGGASEEGNIIRAEFVWV
jgi:hypothetical protein